MKNFILGVIVSMGLLGSVAVFAKTVQISSWYITDNLNSSGIKFYEKTFDENTNVVCYSILTGNGSGISCLKNN